MSGGPGVFYVELKSEIVLSGLGFSIIQATTDKNGVTSVVRSVSMFGSPDPPFLYPYALSVQLSVSSGSVSVVAGTGYSPLSTFDNLEATSACVNDYVPVFSPSSVQASLFENATVGSLVIMHKATDLDVGQSGKLVYTLSAVEPANATSYFQINSSTGEITVKKQIDFETEPSSFALIITATDQGLCAALSSNATLDVSVADVNDVTPAFDLKVYSSVLAENAADGTGVTQIHAFDADVTASFAVVRYSIESSSAGCAFTVDSSSGNVISTSSPPDYEQVKTCTVVVRADNFAGGPSDTATIVVNTTDVNDNTPTFVYDAPFEVTLSESSGVGSLTGVSAQANDIDLGLNAVVTYTLEGSDGASFNVDSLRCNHHIGLA